MGTTSPSEIVHIYASDEQTDFGLRIGSVVKYWNMKFIGSTAGDYDGKLIIESSTTADAITVLKGGNVGLAVTEPDTPLHIYRNATIGAITSQTPTNAGLHIQDSTANMYIDGNTISLDATG